MYDLEKLRDIKKLNKEEFLNSYSYLTEAEYIKLLADLRQIENAIKFIYQTPNLSNSLFIVNFENVADVEEWQIKATLKGFRQDLNLSSEELKINRL